MGKPTKKGKEEAKKQEVPMVHQLSQTAVNHFDDLPNSMLENILGYLDVEDLRTARLVCKGFENSVEYLTRMSIPLTSETLKDFQKKGYRLNELRVVLNRLQIPYRLPARTKRNLGTASTLHFMAEDLRGNLRTIDGSGVQLLLKACQQVETLIFNFHNMNLYLLTSAMDVSRLRFPNLTTLKIWMSNVSFRPVETALFRLKMPCLRHLHVGIFQWNAQLEFRNSKIFLEFLKCLVRHKETLRSLKVFQMLTTTRAINSAIRESGVLDELTDMKLESLEIVHMANESRNWVAAIVLLNNLRGLKVLKLKSDCHQLMTLAEVIILNNCNTLTTLVLEVEPMANVNLDLMTGLTACTILSLSFPERRFGFFPITVEHLKWNAPIRIEWYDPATRTPFPNLCTLSLGPRALENLALDQICHVLFGTPARRTEFIMLLLIHKVVAGYNNDHVLVLTEQLPQEVYTVEVQEDLIRITMP